MSSENKALIWGLEHEKGNPIPQAVKFIIEEESPLFSAPQCPIFESTCEQSQKVLALLLASIQKLVEEEKDYEIADSVPYCQ